MKPIPPSTPWVSWRRAARGRWYQLGTAATERDGWALVYAAMDRAPSSGSFSSCVLRAGERP